MSSSAPIGVFDSGLGGISVARQIAKDMPAEHVLYFGDSANAPYGIKTPEQVRALSFDIVERFVRQGVKAVVIACNTATSAAVNDLREHYDIPIIGMGGIETGEDAAAFMLCGAKAVMVGTANFTDPFACPRIIRELDAYCDQQKVQRAQELVGTLAEY